MMFINAKIVIKLTYGMRKLESHFVLTFDPTRDVLNNECHTAKNVFVGVVFHFASWSDTTARSTSTVTAKTTTKDQHVSGKRHTFLRRTFSTEIFFSLCMLVPLHETIAWSKSNYHAELVKFGKGMKTTTGVCVLYLPACWFSFHFESSNNTNAYIFIGRESNKLT